MNRLIVLTKLSCLYS